MRGLKEISPRHTWRIASMIFSVGSCLFRYPTAPARSTRSANSDFVMHRGDEHLDLIVAGLDLLDQVDAVAGLQRQVDDHHLRVDRLDQPHRLGGVGRLAAHLHVRLGGDGLRQTAPHQGMIVDDHDPHSLAAQRALNATRSRTGFHDWNPPEP